MQPRSSSKYCPGNAWSAADPRNGGIDGREPALPQRRGTALGRILGIAALFLCLSLGLAAAEVGQDLSKLPLPLRTGPSSVEGFRGQVIYLDVWATWCPPCQKSMPWMTSVQQRLGNRGFKVIAISIDQKVEKLEAFLEQHKPGILIGHDPAADLAKTLAVKAMPTAFLIDRKGRLRSIHLGFRPAEAQELEAEIEALLKEE